MFGKLDTIISLGLRLTCKEKKEEEEALPIKRPSAWYIDMLV